MKYHVWSFFGKVFYKIIYGRKVKIGRRVSWRQGFHLIIDKGSVEIGKNVFFNNYCSISSCCKVKIGDDSIFGENVKIYDNNHIFNTENLVRKAGMKSAPIIIGNNCWIGNNVCILKGASMGNNCVVGAGTILRESIPNNTIIKPKNNVERNEIVRK